MRHEFRQAHVRPEPPLCTGMGSSAYHSLIQTLLLSSSFLNDRHPPSRKRPSLTPQNVRARLPAYWQPNCDQQTEHRKHEDNPTSRFRNPTQPFTQQSRLNSPLSRVKVQRWHCRRPLSASGCSTPTLSASPSRVRLVRCTRPTLTPTSGIVCFIGDLLLAVKDHPRSTPP